jgi:WD40 repeat protein
LLKIHHDGRAWAVAFHWDGMRLATCRADATTRVWDTTSGNKLLEVRHNGEVQAMAFSPDGTQLAIGSTDATAQIWSFAGL